MREQEAAARPTFYPAGPRLPGEVPVQGTFSVGAKVHTT